MSELKPCPFCGAMPEVADDGVCRCNNKSCSMAPYWYLPKYWNIRPIEDDLRKRIAELEALVNVSEGLYERIYEQAARIAELEARAEKAEAMVEKLIEAGRMMKQPETIEEFHRGRRDYNALVAEFEAEIVQLTAHYATERQDDKWIPVSERLPEDTERMLTIVYDAFEDTTAISILQHYGDGDWFSWDSGRYVVTHWMPLPELPEVQE